MLDRKIILDLDKKLSKYISDLIGYDLLNKEVIQTRPIIIKKNIEGEYNINILFSMSGYLDQYKENTSYKLKEKIFKQIKDIFIDEFGINKKKIDDLDTHFCDFRIEMQIKANEIKLIDIYTFLKIKGI